MENTTNINPVEELFWYQVTYGKLSCENCSLLIDNYCDRENQKSFCDTSIPFGIVKESGQFEVVNSWKPKND